MQSFALNTLALVAVTNALPSAHKQGHSHARRDNYDLSGVNWAAIDWASVFGKAPAATAAPAAPAVQGNVALANAPAAAAVATPAAAKPATTAAPATPNTPSGSKKGLAWDQGNAASLASLFETGATSWYYNWGSSSSFSSSLQYTPMIKTLGDVGALSSVPAGATVLGFNEPDQVGISAADAAASYLNNFTPLRKSGAIGKLVSPGITNGGSGLPWLQSFVAACSACELDALAVHWYGPDMAMFESQMAAIHAAFPSMKIWVTEIGCTNWNPATNPSPAQVSQFMTDATAWLESTPWIEKYSFFGAMPITDPALGVANEMLNGAGAGSSLTALGQKYVA